MAQVEGTLPYARGRVFPLTLGANAGILSTLSSYNITRAQCAYGTFNGKEYICGVTWLASGTTEDPNASAPSGISTGLIKQVLITTTPKYPNGVLIMYFLPYTASTGVIGDPRFLYYGPNFTTKGYWAVLNSYTSNAASLAGKYLFERDSSTHKYRFTNAAGATVVPYRTGALPIQEVHNIVGKDYKFLVYYLPLT